MPILSNPRHEQFAQALAKGKTADEAYQLAGFSANRGNATRLKANERVSARVAELQGMAAERAVVDREWVLSKLIENATNNQIANPNASNKALELIGKELGMFVDRTENININHDVTDEPATEEDWEAEHRPN